MSRPTIRRLANIEKQAATVLAAMEYPPIPPLAEQKRMNLQELQQLYDRVRRGEYSETPEDVERRLERSKTMDLKGKTPQELADIYEQSIRESEEEVRRELDDLE